MEIKKPIITPIKPSPIKSKIYCKEKIEIGDNTYIGEEVIIRDTDEHFLSNNNTKPIKIGNHVWIGCRNTILKGVRIADNNIISANSTITRSVTEENCVIGGHGQNTGIIKRGIKWKP